MPTLSWFCGSEPFARQSDSLVQSVAEDRELRFALYITSQRLEWKFDGVESLMENTHPHLGTS